MDKSIKKFQKLFLKAKKRGYIESHRPHNTGIGKTFEDICGIIENNFDKADFEGIEIKSHRKLSSSYITLFTKAPTYPKRVNRILRDSFGSFDHEHKTKVLHTSFFYEKFNNHIAGYNYKLSLDEKNEQIHMVVKNTKTGKLENLKIYWDYSDIKEIFSKKLESIAYIEADVKKAKGKEFFHFTHYTIITGITFDKFIKLLKEGRIMFDIRIGTYNSGKKKGKVHDHGSGFRIKKQDMLSQFTKLEI
jgi:hypothetical protein